MGLNFAIDELYASGWSALNTAGCEYDTDGRAYPGVDRVTRDFAESGFELNIRHVQIFDCYRAEWHDGQGQAAGGVVGQSQTEAAVYALSRMRRVAHISGQSAGASQGSATHSIA
jgi:hypothetical protein